MSESEEAIRLLMELRRQGITDKRVLTAIEKVPREKFVSEVFRAEAWDNKALPIAQGQTISQPFIVAYMCQHLEISDRMTVLEIGTGSGYMTAVLAQLARRVYSLERLRELSLQARARLDKLGIVNATLKIGDGLKGWTEASPFDRIVLTAWVNHRPSLLAQQLKDKGILIMPFGESSDSQRLVRIERIGGSLKETELIPVRFVPALEGIARET